ncbi:MAG: DUF2285 domain-containing protein, partial [Alphaproteobacteria bacterium]
MSSDGRWEASGTHVARQALNAASSHGERPAARRASPRARMRSSSPRRKDEVLVSVEIDAERREHWLMSGGRWAIRLDLFDGTLLGGPVLVEHRISGLQSAKPKQVALRQFIVLAQNGGLPRSMMPKESKAALWILELRVGDAVMAGSNQQEIARRLFGGAISPKHWRAENPSYRSRVQRLVK